MSSSLFTVDDFAHSRASSLDFHAIDSPPNATPMRARSDEDASWQPQKSNGFFGNGETGLGAYGELAAFALRGVTSREAPKKLGMAARTVHRLVGLSSLRHLSQVTPSFLLKRTGQLLFPYVTHFKSKALTPIPSVAFEPMSPIDRQHIDTLSPEPDTFIPLTSMLLLRCLVRLTSSRMAGLALGLIPVRLALLASSRLFGISGVGGENEGLTVGEAVVLLVTSAFHCSIGLVLSTMGIGVIGKILTFCLAMSWAVFEVKLLRQRLTTMKEKEITKLVFLFIYGVIEIVLLCLWIHML